MTASPFPARVKLFFVFLITLMPVFLIWALWKFSAQDAPLSASREKYRESLLMPIGRLVMPGEQAVVSAAPVVAFSAEGTYQTVCSTCHATGLLGAPKFGDATAWNARISAAGGLSDVVKIAIAGKGAMPPKGGAKVDDAQFAQVVAYLSGQQSEAAPTEASTPPEVAPVTELATTDQDRNNVVAVSNSPETVAAAEPTQDTTAIAIATVAVDSLVEKTYNSVCSVCHNSGLAGAPKRGDSVAWQERISVAGSVDAVIKIAITGKGAMPPKGGAMSLSDEDFAKVVHYLLGQ